MKQVLVLVALTVISRIGLASTPTLHLLENGTLSFAPLGIPLRSEAVGLLQEEAPVPPPLATAPVAAGVEIPSKGKVIALMVVGGALIAEGVGDLLGALGEFLASSLWATSCQQTGLCGFNPYIAAAVILLVVGVVAEGVGIPLLIIGNSNRVRRNELLSARNVSVSYDPATRSSTLAYAIHF